MLKGGNYYLHQAAMGAKTQVSLSLIVRISLLQFV